MNFKNKYYKYKKKYFNLLGSSALYYDDTEKIKDTTEMDDNFKPIVIASSNGEYIKQPNLDSCLGIIIYIVNKENKRILNIIGYHLGGYSSTEEDYYKEADNLDYLINIVYSFKNDNNKIILHIYKNKAPEEKQEKDIFMRYNFKLVEYFFKEYEYLFENITNIENKSQYLKQTTDINPNTAISKKVGQRIEPEPIKFTGQQPKIKQT